jgi:F-box domain
MSTSLLAMPNEILLETITHLNYFDLIKLLSTCRHFYSLSKTNIVRCALLDMEFAFKVSSQEHRIISCYDRMVFVSGELIHLLLSRSFPCEAPPDWDSRWCNCVRHKDVLIAHLGWRAE